MIVIPAPYQVRGKLQPESSRSPGERREPFKTLAPGFHRESWTPVFTGETTFYETIN
jgi:hypothetical protein